MSHKKEETPQFRYATETERKRIKKSKDFNPQCDKVIMKSVVTADDFLRVWKEINNETKMDDNEMIQEMHVYSHGGIVRLYFLESEITPRQIKKLDQLNWANDSEIFLHGCYTGVSDLRGESAATCFTKSQEVKAVGQPKSSDFSTSEKHRSIFTVVNRYSREMYLLSYGEIDGLDFGPVLPSTSLFVPTNSAPIPKCKKPVLPPKKP